MSLASDIKDSGVAVWGFREQRFIPFVPCPGEERVRIDVFGSESLGEDYAVYEVDYLHVSKNGESRFNYNGHKHRRLPWRIDWT